MENIRNDTGKKSTQPLAKKTELRTSKQSENLNIKNANVVG